jgi:cytidylate kinase
VSAVSAHAAVRSSLVPLQRALVQPPGLIMAGRDIGTVIVPDAPLKVWLSASLNERARRRAHQTGEPLGAVRERMAVRDQVDGSRTVAPMARAPDAVAVGTDGVPVEQVIAHIVDLARARGAPSSVGSRGAESPARSGARSAAQNSCAHSAAQDP